MTGCSFQLGRTSIRFPRAPQAAGFLTGRTVQTFDLLGHDFNSSGHFNSRPLAVRLQPQGLEQSREQVIRAGEAHCQRFNDPVVCHEKK
jgi:hypothetical protein